MLIPVAIGAVTLALIIGIISWVTKIITVGVLVRNDVASASCSFQCHEPHAALVTVLCNCRWLAFSLAPTTCRCEWLQMKCHAPISSPSANYMQGS
jgi:hypothetical protein